MVANLSCDIRTAYLGIAPGTVQHAGDLIREDCEGALPRGNTYFSADLRTYFRKRNIPYLAVTKAATLPISTNLVEHYSESGELYRPSRDEMKTVLQDSSTAVFNLDDLWAYFKDSPFDYTEVGIFAPVDYQTKMTPEGIRLAEYVCGGSEPLAKFAEKNNGLRINFHHPRFVLETAKEGPFMEYSVLDLPDKDGRLRGFYLRGEPRSQ